MVFNVLYAAEPEPGSGPLVNWHPYTNSLFMDASNEGKLILIYLYADDCQFSKHLSETTLSDPAFLQFLEQHFVPAKANVRREKHIAGKYEVTLVPTIVVLDTHNYILGKTSGYKDAKALQNYLNYIFMEYQSRRMNQPICWGALDYPVIQAIVNDAYLTSVPPICMAVRCFDGI